MNTRPFVWPASTNGPRGEAAPPAQPAKPAPARQVSSRAAIGAAPQGAALSAIDTRERGIVPVRAAGSVVQFFCTETECEPTSRSANVYVCTGSKRNQTRQSQRSGRHLPHRILSASSSFIVAHRRVRLLHRISEGGQCSEPFLRPARQHHLHIG